jgi:CRISPR-associated protein Csm1
MSEREALYIGALLHDIGKFEQRTDSSDKKYTKHQVLSTIFVRDLLENDVVNTLVALHHKEDLVASKLKDSRKRLLAEIVGIADNLASMERKQNVSVRKQLPLTSIFSLIASENQPKSSQKYVQPLSSLSPRKYSFPQQQLSNTQDLVNDYASHWERFEGEVDLLQKDEWRTLQALLKKYTWCMPSSSYNTEPDISLYEHSRLTAAIAVCLYDVLHDRKMDRLPDKQDVICRLVCGDITGIQKYIYNIGHKGAMKALKGRSFAVQEMTQTIANMIVQKFNLFDAHVIYASGGKFYVLVPDIQSVEQDIKSLEAEIQDSMLQEYNGAPSFVLANIPLSMEDFSAIPKKWKELSDALEFAKKKKYSTLLKQPNNNFFMPFGAQGNVVLCHATGVELCEQAELDGVEHNGSEKDGYVRIEINSTTRIYQEIPDDNAIEHTVRYVAKEYYDSLALGKDLRDVDWMWYGESQHHSLLPGIGHGKRQRFGFEPSRRERELYAVRLNNDDFLSHRKEQQQDIQRGWRFYGGHTTTDTDFDTLIAKAQGFKRLAVLRMDVDNLGRIFRDGLGDQATFSRVVQLSQMLDFFFSSYLNKLMDLRWSLEQGVSESVGTPINELASIVYSGGDDLFIVGVWNVIPDIAVWIQQEFTTFTCGNTQFSISGGIALFEQHFPLVKAAMMAGEAEHQAKTERSDKFGAKKAKAAVSFLGVTVSWNDLEYVRNKARDIVQRIEAKELNRGFLQRLHAIHAEYKRGKHHQWGQWRWRAVYSLSRFVKEQKNEGTQQFIESFQAELMMSHISKTTEEDIVTLLPIIATYAEYLTRKNQE